MILKLERSGVVQGSFWLLSFAESGASEDLARLIVDAYQNFHHGLSLGCPAPCLELSRLLISLSSSRALG